jgi:hypothetical protein
VVLIDCDTIIVRDPSPWLNVTGIAAKIADFPTVKLEELQRVFDYVGEPMPTANQVHDLGGQPTIAYCNSGVVVVNEAHRKTIAKGWDRWNQALLAAPPELAFERYHVDQVSLALAIETSGVEFTPLPVELNLPGHLDQYPASWQDLDPVIIHYHWLAYSNGFLKPNPLRRCSLRIESFNSRLRAEMPAAPLPQAVAQLSGASPKVVVGSGWWCEDSVRDWKIGDSATRSIPFFDVWYRQVMRCLRPLRVVVTDSAAPVKPDYTSYPLLQWLELDSNYGHAIDIRLGSIKTKYSGFTRSVINGAAYALCCDADFFVYVEQDCLVFGDDLLARATGDSAADIFLGMPSENAKGLNGGIAAPMLQQSLMVVRRAGLERFLEGLLGAPWTDGECSPEETMRLRLAPFELTRIPYGRSRPIDFNAPAFYVQHLEGDDLQRALQAAGASLVEPEFAFSGFSPVNQKS